MLNGGIQPDPIFSVFHSFQYQNNSRGIKVDPEFKKILKEAAGMKTAVFVDDR